MNFKKIMDLDWTFDMTTLCLLHKKIENFVDLKKVKIVSK
jgi:hypothetical protein